MKRLIQICLVAASLLALPPAWASFHTFGIDEIFSNADGTVQFVVIKELDGFDDQEFWPGHALKANGPNGPSLFAFPHILPSRSTARKKVLIGTAGFAALGIVTPDFVIPNGFIQVPSGSLDYSEGTNVFNYVNLPTDGASALYRSGVAANVATNFAGQSASVVIAPPAALSFQGIWWASPAASESGWGLNIAHQGDTIFASWFTYDQKGRGWWLVMTANKTGPNTYVGDILETSGPAFDSVPFNPALVTVSKTGSGTLTFSDANTGTFAYTVSKGSDVSQVKNITRQVFGPLPVCTFGTQPNLALATNYQDIWWAKPAASESGWGINLNHQGDTIFATWFTYDHDGTPLWLVATAPKSAPNVYTGDLFRTTGPPFSAVPFDPKLVVATKVGTATFTFADGNSATFHYDITGIGANPVSQTKAITRQVFMLPGTVCN